MLLVTTGVWAVQFVPDPEATVAPRSPTAANVPFPKVIPVRRLPCGCGLRQCQVSIGGPAEARSVPKKMITQRQTAPLLTLPVILWVEVIAAFPRSAFI